MRNSTEVQEALLAALESMQAEHSKEVETLRSVQQKHYNYFSTDRKSVV